MGVLTHIILHTKINNGEATKKKFLTNCVKTKGLKKYLYFLLEAYLKTTTSKKISLSLSKYNFQLLKKVYFSHRYGVLHTTGSTIQHQKKKTKTTYRRSYVNLISLSLKYISYFFYANTYYIEILKDVF
jgi:hypothetical protein